MSVRLSSKPRAVIKGWFFGSPLEETDYQAANSWWTENLMGSTTPPGTPLTSDLDRLTPDQWWGKCQQEMRENVYLRQELENARYNLMAEKTRVKDMENFIFTNEGELENVDMDPVVMLQRMMTDTSVDLYEHLKTVERLVLRILLLDLSHSAAESGQYEVPYWRAALNFDMDEEYPLNDVHTIARNLAIFKHGPLN